MTVNRQMAADQAAAIAKAQGRATRTGLRYLVTRRDELRDEPVFLVFPARDKRLWAADETLIYDSKA